MTVLSLNPRGLRSNWAGRAWWCRTAPGSRPRWARRDGTNCASGIFRVPDISIATMSRTRRRRCEHAALAGAVRVRDRSTGDQCRTPAPRVLTSDTLPRRFATGAPSPRSPQSAAPEPLLPAPRGVGVPPGDPRSMCRPCAEQRLPPGIDTVPGGDPCRVADRWRSARIRQIIGNDRRIEIVQFGTALVERPVQEIRHLR